MFGNRAKSTMLNIAKSGAPELGAYAARFARIGAAGSAISQIDKV